MRKPRSHIGGGTGGHHHHGVGHGGRSGGRRRGLPVENLPSPHLLKHGGDVVDVDVVDRNAETIEKPPAVEQESLAISERKEEWTE